MPLKPVPLGLVCWTLGSVLGACVTDEPAPFDDRTDEPAPFDDRTEPPVASVQESSACTTDLQCDDLNPCTADRCEGGRCLRTPIADQPAPNAVQLDDDCVEVRCVGGELVTVERNDERPDDGNDCTVDGCEGGARHHAAAADGTACSAGTCQSGKCYGCTDASQCWGTDDACQTRVCLGGFCDFVYPSGPLPPDLQSPGDCRHLLCNGAGFVTSLPADDPKDDGNDCTKDACQLGQPTYAPMPTATSCAAGVCDGGGACVECVSDSQCPGPHDTCGGGGMANHCGCTPITCAQTSVTCGAVGNGCGGVLFCGSGCTKAVQTCGNGVPDGGETDVDCGGDPSSCATRCWVGKKCAADSDCGSVYSPTEQDFHQLYTYALQQMVCGAGTCVPAACETCIACDAPCRTVKDYYGTYFWCEEAPVYTQDAYCNGANACDWLGECLLALGQPCKKNDECASHLCYVNPWQPGPGVCKHWK